MDAGAWAVNQKPRSNRRLLYHLSTTITAYMRQGWDSRKVSKNTCYSGEDHTKQKGSMVCAGAAGARKTPTHVVARSEWQ